MADNSPDDFDELDAAPWLDEREKMFDRLPWDEDEVLPTSVAKTIVSVGLGALWNPIAGLYAELYWGKDLDDQDLPTESWQDRGFHYQVSYQAQF